MKTLFIILFSSLIMIAQTKYPEINNAIAAGSFDEAKKLIEVKLNSGNLDDEEKYNLNFQIDKMERIKKDFNKTRDDIKKQLSKYYTDLTDSMIDAWEKDNSLEMKMINSEKKYFRNAVPNLFRVNKEAQKIKQAVEGKTYHSKLNQFLSKHLPESVQKISESDLKIGNPVRIKINYTLTVDKNAVPAGETIRCWLPYPREGHSRQTDIKLISVNDDNYTIADNEYPQRTLYMEKKAVADSSTVFNMQLEYTAYSEWHNVNADSLKPYRPATDLYREYTSERPPHIVFTDKIKALSEKIVGRELNPYKKLKLIYTWVDENIPWASAREYSTIDSISNYCINNMHGDCGIKTLLFITLCRYNGIPAKWQSGWMLHPGSVNLHDWSEVYLEEYGWVPVDQDYGIQESNDERVKYYYTNGIDSYRLIVNDDYSKPLYPPKKYPRSETIDFQRGEVEWDGGNLYFDKWDYNMEVEYQMLNQ